MLSWLRTRQKSPIAEYQAPSLRFVGEQDGLAERELKALWVGILSQTPGIARAFLARAASGADEEPNVMLCICPRVHEPHTLVQQLAVPFRAAFGADQHLDIVFLNAAQEADVALVAKPFFPAT